MEPGANTLPWWKNPDLHARHHIQSRPQQPERLGSVVPAGWH